MKKPILCFLLMVLCCSWSSSFPVAAQLENKGQLGVWTTRTVERQHSVITHLRVVRAARQKGFDRVVFEFEGPVPNYSIGYLKGRFFESDAGTERIKIAGRAFLQISLSVIPMDEIQSGFSFGKNFAPEGKLKMRSLQQVDEKALFEGVYDFLLGIKSRQAFRVTELANPSRLAVDFKH